MPPETTLDLVVAGEPCGTVRPVHVGALVPWANAVVEAELPSLCIRGVVFHYARLVPPSRATALDDGFLNGLHAAIPAALASLSRLPLASVLLACTSAGFASTGESPSGVVTAFDALTVALNRLGADRIALATPYPRPLTETEADAFAKRGITVTAHASLGRDDGYSDITGEEVRALVEGIDPAALTGADALVLSCTAWPTLDLIAGLEASLGIPVLSSNLAMAAHAASLTHTRRVPQCGWPQAK